MRTSSASALTAAIGACSCAAHDAGLLRGPVLRFAVHMLLHVAAPAAAARLWWSDRWRTAWMVMLATMVVDLDHLLSRPVFDAHRCSIGHHPLHTWPAIGAYALLAAFPKSRWVGVGLLIHMALDALDCLLMNCC